MAPPGAWLAYYPVVRQAPQTGRTEDRRPHGRRPASAHPTKGTSSAPIASRLALPCPRVVSHTVAVPQRAAFRQ